MPAGSGRIAAFVVAAGRGIRVGAGDERPKQYRDIGGVPMLRRTVAAFLAHPAVDDVLVAIDPAHRALYEAAVAGLDGLMEPVIGGATRQASVLAGLEALALDPPDLVLVHDAARPFITPDVIDRAIAALAERPAVLAAVPVVDTLKRADAGGRVVDTPSRDGLWAAQTPQGFRFATILAAHKAAAAVGETAFTDDAAVAEWAGIPVGVVRGDGANIKITTAEDLAAADRRCSMAERAFLDDIRVGTGYDVHRFVPGDHVTLCGVRIAHEARLDGHSDADVALHALTDALLGAIGDGDIGQHFPPSDQRWRGADSAVFVRFAADRIAALGGIVAHVDVSILAEAPKIGPHREAMRARIAEILGIAIGRVGVKATTNEKLGFVGRREGLAALATATVRLPSE